MKDSQKYLSTLPSINEKPSSVSTINNHQIGSSIVCPSNSNICHIKNCHLCQEQTAQITNICAGFLPCCLCQSNKKKQKYEILNYMSQSIKQQEKINQQLKKLNSQLQMLASPSYISLKSVKKNRNSKVKTIKSPRKSDNNSQKKLVVQAPKIKYKESIPLKRIKSDKLLQKQEVRNSYYSPQIYKDSQYRNRKHQRDHLVYTYQQQKRLRQSLIKKLRQKSEKQR